MKIKTQRFLAVMYATVILLAITSCQSTPKTENDQSYDIGALLYSVDSSVVAENKESLLSWDNERNCVILTSKKTGKTWSTIPYEYYKQQEESSGRARIMMESPLMLSYISGEDSSIKSVIGYTGIVKYGRSESELIENGIKVTYYFDQVKIAIPVCYTLTGSGLKVTVIPSEITEGENLVDEISLAPFMCSAKNDKDNYIFVPSGSGALMYTDEREDGISRTFSGEVYGIDRGQMIYEKLSNDQSVRLPVFGSRDGNDAICAIIENGAEAAKIEANVGEGNIGYSSAYATFKVRGNNISEISYGDAYGKGYILNFADDITAAEAFSVSYYPLSGSDADYVGIAERYRNLLIDKYAMERSTDDKILSVKLLGGAEATQYILGVPYTTVIPVTTFDQALSIVKQLNQKTYGSIDVQLYGFGKSGLDVGKVGGGFGFGKAFGNMKSMNLLKEFCQDAGIPLYIDFDIIRYNSSSIGFSTYFDSSKTANNFTAYQYEYSVALRDIDDNYSKYWLLKRSKLNSSADSLIKAIGKHDLTGVSLSTLGSVIYSDYSDKKYYVKNSMEEDVSDIIKRFSAIPVCVEAANAYAAVHATKVINAPTHSGQYSTLDVDIPFYQIVFKGYKSLSAEPINLAYNSKIQYLKSLEGGSSIAFSLTGTYSTELAETKHSELLSSNYKDNAKTIDTMVDDAEAFLKSVLNLTISDHEILSQDVHKTTFSNGIKLYVNYSDNIFDTEDGTVAAQDFLFVL